MRNRTAAARHLRRIRADLARHQRALEQLVAEHHRLGVQLDLFAALVEDDACPQPLVRIFDERPPDGPCAPAMADPASQA